MDQDEIYQALKSKGLTTSILADALDVSVPAIFNVIKKGKGSQRIASAISIAINKPLEQVFPYYAKKLEKQETRQEQVNQLKSRFVQIN